MKVVAVKRTLRRTRLSARNVALTARPFSHVSTTAASVSAASIRWTTTAIGSTIVLARTTGSTFSCSCSTCFAFALSSYFRCSGGPVWARLGWWSGIQKITYPILKSGTLSDLSWPWMLHPWIRSKICCSHHSFFCSRFGGAFCYSRCLWAKGPC